MVLLKVWREYQQKYVALENSRCDVNFHQLETPFQPAIQLPKKILHDCVFQATGKKSKNVTQPSSSFSHAPKKNMFRKASEVQPSTYFRWG